MRYKNRRQRPQCCSMMSLPWRSHNDYGCISRGTTADGHNRSLLNLYQSFHLSSPHPPPPPPVPIPGSPENPIDINTGTRESPIEIQDDPELVVNDESNEEFPFRGQTSPLVVNDWEGQVDWGAVRRCGNCGLISHGTWWCREGLTYNSEMGFWYTDKSGEIWRRRGAVLWFHRLSGSFSLPIRFIHLFHCFIIVSRLIISHWLMLHLEGCAWQHTA